MLAFSRRHVTPGSPPGTLGDVVLVVLNLDTHAVAECSLQLLLPELGLDWSDRVRATDLLTGASYEWGEWAYVRLDPHEQPTHVLHLTRPDEPQQGVDAA